MSRRSRGLFRPAVPSSRTLGLLRRLRTSSARWSLRRVRKLREAAERKLRLLLEWVDSQHLRIKELEQRELMLEHRLSELSEISRYRLAGVLANPETTQEHPEMDELLGL